MVINSFSNLPQLKKHNTFLTKSPAFKNNSYDAILYGRGFLGETTLNYATEDKDFKTAQSLIQLGADVNAADIFGNTSLHNASSKGDLKIVKLLIENGATIDKRNIWGQTPIDKAKKYPEVVAYLKEEDKKQKQISNDNTKSQVAFGKKLYISA